VSPKAAANLLPFVSKDNAKAWASSWKPLQLHEELQYLYNVSKFCGKVVI